MLHSRANFDYPSKPIMCAVIAHKAFPLIFANIAKNDTPKRLLCMQCFKENTVIDKKQLLELAKLQVDYGQRGMKQHREDLKSQLDTYLETLEVERQQKIEQLSAQCDNYRESFHLTLQDVQQQLSEAIQHQIEYRMSIVELHMQREIAIQLPEEIVDDILQTSHNNNDHLERGLNARFTTKGLVLYDRHNRQSHNLQRVDLMLNSRVTINDDNINQVLVGVQERIRSIMAQVIIPDVQKLEQLTVSGLIIPTTYLDTAIVAPQHQIINIFFKEDGWVEAFKQALTNPDWFSEHGIKQIMKDWRHSLTCDLRINQLDLYPRPTNQSQLVFIKCPIDKSREEPSLQQMFDLLTRTQIQIHESNENHSIILSRDILTTPTQIKKVLDNLKTSKYLIRNLCISFKQRELEENQLSFICSDLIHIIREIKNLNIDLSSNKLGDSCIQHLKPVLKISINMRMLTLNLESNGFGHHNCQLLSQCLMQLKTLVFLHLNLNSNKVTDIGCNNMAVAISQLNNMTHLGLTFNNNKVGEAGVKSLNKSISQLTNLTHLLIQLNNNQIGNKGFQTTFEHLGSLKSMISMTLSYRNNQIQSSCLQMLESMLNNYQNLDEFKLDLASNNIGDQGMQSLSQAIASKRFLKCLHVNVGNNALSKQGIYSLGQALNLLGQLEDLSLNFEDNQLESNHLLSYGLKNKVRLKSLELQLKNLNNVNGKVFQSIMQEGQQMIELQCLNLVLANNNIEDANLEQIMATLQTYLLIEDLNLDLSHTLLTNLSIDHICNMIGAMNHLTTLELNLTGNKINDEGINKLVQCLSRVKTLTKLVLIVRNTISKHLTFVDLKNQILIRDVKIYI